MKDIIIGWLGVSILCFIIEPIAGLFYFCVWGIVILSIPQLVKFASS
jgi:membrane protein implicated in regulation of membrane protease activity